MFSRSESLNSLEGSFFPNFSRAKGGGKFAFLLNPRDEKKRGD